jgi:hypothetical protein
MKASRFWMTILAACLLLIQCKNNRNDYVMDMDRVFAWCIVPFDSMQRTPQQRIEMLKELGIKKYAYDWRDKHLDEMVGEWKLARENQIEVSAVWLWLDERTDTIGKLSPANERLFANLDSAGLHTDLWLSFNANYFDSLSQDQALAKAVAIVDYIAGRAKSLGCKLVLYNHGDWFGEPGNQVQIIRALPGQDIGIVYSFHHVHHQLDRFQPLLDTMLPYLKAVNLNGMRRDGPKILALNEGDEEQAMIRTLLAKGYTGPLGILGHVEEADVKQVLEKNKTGLEAILSGIAKRE